MSCCEEKTTLLLLEIKKNIEGCQIDFLFCFALLLSIIIITTSFCVLVKLKKR